MRTEFTQVARRELAEQMSTEPEFVYVSVEQVVADALQGIERNQAIVIPGLMMKLGMFLVRLTPDAIAAPGEPLARVQARLARSRRTQTRRSPLFAYLIEQP